MATAFQTHTGAAGGVAQAILFSLCISKLNNNILPFDVSKFAQPLLNASMRAEIEEEGRNEVCYPGNFRGLGCNAATEARSRERRKE